MMSVFTKMENSILDEIQSDLPQSFSIKSMNESYCEGWKIGYGRAMAEIERAIEKIRKKYEN